MSLPLVLAACGTTSSPSSSDVSRLPSVVTAPTTGHYKVGDPYNIGGVWYKPTEDYAYDETGIASWYGPGFHRRATANGENFDTNELTAAHRTLPMPSLVRVTNLDNGRSLVVRVNDRGPFSGARIIDVSRRAAQLLGFERQGTAKVRVQILAEESRAIADAAHGNGTQLADGAPRMKVRSQTLQPPPVIIEGAPSDIPGHEVKGRFLPSEVVSNERVAGAKQIFVQAGSFTALDHANHLKEKLSRIAAANVAKVTVKGVDFYRVRLGPIASVDQADKILAQTNRAGVSDARVVVD